MLCTGTTTDITEFYFMVKHLGHITYRAQCMCIFRHSHNEDWIEVLNPDNIFLCSFKKESIHCKYSLEKIALVKINFSSCFSVKTVNRQVDIKQLQLEILLIREDTVTERLDYLFNTRLIRLSSMNSCWSFGYCKKSGTLQILWAVLSQNLFICIQSLCIAVDLSEAIPWILYKKIMQLVSRPMALLSDCYGREQRGELPKMQLLGIPFLQRTETGRIFLWVLERPADS